MSAINTNGINTNYPIPGTNNSTQGFRNNFTNIKTNLDTAGNEITDLQNNVVLKSPLANLTLNNDMANTLISNAAIRSFRSTTYNLGNALTGTVLVDASLGDVQYGNLNGNVTLNFSSWAPINTEQNITLVLGNLTNKEVTFSSEVTGLANIENYIGSQTITPAYDISSLTFNISTVDCGNTLNITPINRPYQSAQIETRIPPSTGQQGDVNGTICVSPSLSQQKVTSSNAADYFTTTGNTTQFYTGLPVIFTGTSFEANITSGNTYYIRNVVSSTTFTVSSTFDLASNVNLSGSTGNMYVNPVNYMYVATDDYSANTYVKTLSSTSSGGSIYISSSFANINLNAPIMFTGSQPSNTGLSTNTVYYIKTFNPMFQSIDLSLTRENGVAGPQYFGILSTVNIDVDAVVFDGPDIFKRIPLTPF